MPLFSVIVPAYNRARWLPATLNSVLHQRLRDYEVLVVDDGSTDETAEVARSCPEVRLIRRDHNQGSPCFPRNDGIAAAHGEYCVLLDSDDLWAPWTLESFQRAIAEFGRPAIVNCGGKVGIREEMNLDGVIAGEAFSACCFADYIDFRSGSMRELLLLTGMAIRTDLLREVGGFRGKFRCFYEDQDLWLRLGTQRGFVRIDRPLCWGYRDHATNLSKTFDRQIRGVHLLIDAERHGEYPGGVARRQQRRGIIAATARYVSREALHRARVQKGLGVYGRCLRWNMRQGRWSYLLGYPALAGVVAGMGLLKAVTHRGTKRAQPHLLADMTGQSPVS